NVTAPGPVKFNFKTSSEYADMLKFYVNNVQIDAFSGVMPGWSSFMYNVPAAGQTVFRWEYVKDASVSSGTDTTWIDDVQFPPYNLAGASIPTFVADNFERAYNCFIGSSEVGGSWMKTDGGNLCIDNNRLRFYMSSPNHGFISQQMDGGPAFQAQADMQAGSVSGYGCHYSHWLFRNFDGTVNSGSDAPKAHAVRVYRNNCTTPSGYTDSSKVELWDNGSIYDLVYSSFQFYGALRVSATFYADGSVRGRILELESQSPFEFSFATKTVLAAGNKVGAGMSLMDSGAPWASIDSFTASGLGFMYNPYFGAGGAGIFPPGYFTQISST
ncbi:MAG: hypothetical protein WC881_11390, partial [Elusimicrobiota bacterium]